MEVKTEEKNVEDKSSSSTNLNVEAKSGTEGGSSHGTPQEKKKRKQVVMDDTGILLGVITDFVKVGGMIGHGAFGEVRRGVMKGTNIKVALKFINKSQSVKHNIDLTVEGKLLRKLGSHMNVLKYIGLYETEDKLQYVIATEYSKGGDLLTLLNNVDYLATGMSFYRLTEPQLGLLFFQMVSAVYHCHRYNVIHRDIKTNNILCTKNTLNVNVDSLEDAPLKLADFGEAVVCPAHSKVRGGGGTYAFMSPERLQKRTYGFAADIWSLGVTLWELASGTVPWRGSTRADILQQMQKILVIDENIPLESSHGKDMFKKIFNHEANKRPTAQQLINHPWVCGECPATSCNKVKIRELRRQRILQRFRSTVRALIAGHRLARLSAAKACEPLFATLALYIKDSEDIKRLSTDMFQRTYGAVEITREAFIQSLIFVLNLHTEQVPEKMFRRFSQVSELMPVQRRKSAEPGARRMSSAACGGVGNYDLAALLEHEKKVKAAKQASGEEVKDIALEVKDIKIDIKSNVQKPKRPSMQSPGLRNMEQMKIKEGEESDFEENRKVDSMKANETHILAKQMSDHFPKLGFFGAGSCKEASINIVSFCFSLISKVDGSLTEKLTTAFELVDRTDSGNIQQEEFVMIIQSIMFLSECGDELEKHLKNLFTSNSQTGYMNLEQFLKATTKNERVLKYFDRVSHLHEGTKHMFQTEIEQTADSKQGWLFWSKSNVLSNIKSNTNWKDRFFAVRDGKFYGWVSFEAFSRDEEADLCTVLDSKTKVSYNSKENGRHQIKLKNKKCSWLLEAKTTNLLSTWNDIFKHSGCDTKGEVKE